MNYLKKVWSILSSEYKKKSIILFFLIIISVFLEVLGIGLIVPVVIFFLEDDISGKYPILLEIVSFFYSEPEKIHLIQFSLVSLLIVYFVKNLFLSLIAYLESKFSWGVYADVQRRLFDYYINEELSFHSKKNSANLINNTTKEISVLFHVVMHSVVLFSEIFVFLGVALLLIFYQPLAFFAVGAISGLVIGIYNLMTGKKLSTLGKIRQREDELIIQKVQQGLGGIRELKIYNRESGFTDFFIESNKNLFSVSWKSQFIQKLPKLLLEFATVFSMIVVVLIFLSMDLTTSYIVTVLALFGLAAVRILPSLVRIYNSIQIVQFGVPAVDLINKELKEVKSIEKNENRSEVKPLSFDKSIKLENLSFVYPGSKNEIFNKINFEIPKGKLTGIEGASGSGKSTLVDLILGLIKPDSGKILVDNLDISESLLSWQKNVSYVPQSVFLTDDSIKKNIAFGLKDKEIDETKLKNAVLASELDQFVKTLPQKLETVIGERGARLSGGQRQRIGLARALYHEPELLVLDETTSSLESEIEKKIMQTILKIQKNKTVIIISHDQKLLSDCELIYSIKNKNIVRKK